MERKGQQYNCSINLSSLAIGFLLALCLALALGAVKQDESAGPYRCSAVSEGAVFVIDTQTGHTWQLSRSDHLDLGTPIERKSVRKSVTPMVE